MIQWSILVDLSLISYYIIIFWIFYSIQQFCIENDKNSP